MWGRGKPSLPALLLVLSQSLRVAAHLCEALGAGGGANAHPTFLGGLDLCQNVPDLSLSQLEVQKGEWGREERGRFVNAKHELIKRGINLKIRYQHATHS